METPHGPSTKPLPPVRPIPGAGTFRDCATIVAVALAVAGLLRPFQDTPFIDDWVYSWSVQHLLETREFLFPELVGNPIAAQVLWGALFCLPFGFSLAALRVSTWVLGVLAVCALYLLVRECGGTRRAALMAAAVLGSIRSFFILSPTFMTDVPFLAAMLWSVLLFVRALHRRRVALVWLAAAVCAASVGSRAIGVGVAGAMVATLLFHTGHWGRRIHVWLAPALVGPVAVWLLVWTRARVFISADITSLPNGPQQRLANLRYAFNADIFPPLLVVTVLSALVLVGIALLPLAVGMARRAIVRRATYALALFAAAWVIARRAGLNAWIPFEAGSIWALREIGAGASFVPGWQADPLPWWVAASGVAVALTSAAILVAAWPQGSLREAEKFLVWNIAAQALLVAVLWLTDDRMRSCSCRRRRRSFSRAGRPCAPVRPLPALPRTRRSRWQARTITSTTTVRCGPPSPICVPGVSRRGRSTAAMLSTAGCNFFIQTTRIAIRPDESSSRWWTISRSSPIGLPTGRRRIGGGADLPVQRMAPAGRSHLCVEALKRAGRLVHRSNDSTRAARERRTRYFPGSAGTCREVRRGSRRRRS